MKSRGNAAKEHGRRYGGEKANRERRQRGYIDTTLEGAVTGTDKCPTGKRRYANKKAATVKLGVMARKGGGMGGANRLNVYRCRNCGSYHIGHRPTRLT